MDTKVFRDLYDDYFYLSVTTVLNHKYYAYIQPQAIPRNEQNLNENERSLLNTLSNVLASNTMISQIFEKIKGTSFREFIQKTISNMNAKTNMMFDLLRGIPSDMTDAEKMLKQLKMCVHVLPVECNVLPFASPVPAIMQP